MVLPWIEQEVAIKFLGSLDMLKLFLFHVIVKVMRQNNILLALVKEATNLTSDEFKKKLKEF
jgi:predicted phosphatase